jgi:hypothetical protein
VRVYLPEEQDAPVVICSELPASEGASITNVAEQLAAEVIHYYRLPAPVGWIAHDAWHGRGACREGAVG